MRGGIEFENEVLGGSIAPGIDIALGIHIKGRYVRDSHSGQARALKIDHQGFFQFQIVGFAPNHLGLKAIANDFNPVFEGPFRPLRLRSAGKDGEGRKNEEKTPPDFHPLGIPLVPYEVTLFRIGTEVKLRKLKIVT